MGVKGLADLISGGFDSLCLRFESISTSDVQIISNSKKNFGGSNADSQISCEHLPAVPADLVLGYGTVP